MFYSAQTHEPILRLFSTVTLKVAGTVLLVCNIFTICGYHNYAASGYVIRYNSMLVACYLGKSRHRLSESVTDVELKLL